mmetsp:Transcript_37841/g.113001  ORF Transcript_37841/g.113001 Transcript_37841/m.113001 type:complete len:280 (-) Transcript_37841:56-895(-)
MSGQHHSSEAHAGPAQPGTHDETPGESCEVCSHVDDGAEDDHRDSHKRRVHWQYYGGKKRRVISGTELRQDKQKQEHELFWMAGAERELEMELLRALEDHLRGSTAPVLVRDLQRQVVWEWQRQRLYLSSHQRYRINVRRSLIQESGELIWVPGREYEDNSVRWDPAGAARHAAATAPASSEDNPERLEALPRCTGRVKSFNMSAGYGFITSEEVPRDVYFRREEFPGSLQQRKVCGGDREARRSDWFQGYEVSFHLDLANPTKPQAKAIEFLQEADAV